MMNRPDAAAVGLVSVVTPCYNAAAFVAETIESVAAQTYPSVEHIVVDDCSTDGSWEVIQQYADPVTPIRLPENRGGSYARNRGAEIARGQYIMFLDADDLIAPGTIAALVSAVREMGEVAVCPWQWLRQERSEWQAAPAEVPLPDPAGDPLRGWVTGRSWVPPCAVLWRREAYNRVGGWDEDITLNDDTDLMLRALLDPVHLVVAKRGEALYRTHGSSRISVSTNFTMAKMQSQLRVLEKLETRLTEQGKLTQYSGALGSAYQQTALIAFREGFRELGRKAQRRGEALAGKCFVSPTLIGRLLVMLFGAERKEAIVSALARIGIATPGRRRFTQLRRLQAQSTTTNDGQGGSAA